MGIVVSEYTGGNQNGAVGSGLLDAKVHATPEAAAKDIIERRARNEATVAYNKDRTYGKVEPTRVEIHETNLAPGSRVSVADVSQAKPGTLHTIKGHVTKGLAGLALAGLAGAAAAAEPGATPASVGNAMAATAVPGWNAARQGQACRAFGEATGYVAAGLTITAGATVTTTVAIGAGAATGPMAPVTAAAVALGGAALTVKAADGAATLAGGAGEAACNAVNSGVTKIKTAFGFGA